MNNGLGKELKAVAHSRLRGWSVILGVAACSTALELGGDAARDWARYDRARVAAGELWRLVTGHLVHLGWGHLWPNLLALAIVGTLFEDALTPLGWLLAALLAAFAIDLGLYFVNTDVQWYVGLSGVLHGLVACGALVLLGRGSRIGMLLAAGLLAKIVFEQTVGPMPFTRASAGGPVVVAAHLYGAAAGAVAAALLAIVRARRSRL